MNHICPTVLASTKEEFDTQLKRASFAPRVQLDFMDGEFAPTQSIKLTDANWSSGQDIDLHLMYQRPMDYLDIILENPPSLVIVHAEADVNLAEFAKKMHENDIKAGVCLLPETRVEDIKSVINEYDHLLVFGGKLGYFGGKADLSQTKKARQAKTINPKIETGWDGGANDKNVAQLIADGIDIVNFGGYIQKAKDPESTYNTLVQLVS